MTAITTAPSTTPDVGFVNMWYGRLDYSLHAEDTLFEAWKTIVDAGTDTDEQWYASRYSSYVLQFKYDNTNNGSYGGNTDDVLWSGLRDGNAWCIKDARESTNLGGYCLFPYLGTDTSGATAKTISMKSTDFALLENLWVASGKSLST